MANLSELEPNKILKQTVVVGDQRLEADLVLPCIGLPPNKPSIDKLISPENIDENNRIKVAMQKCQNKLYIWCWGCCVVAKVQFGGHFLKMLFIIAIAKVLRRGL